MWGDQSGHSLSRKPAPLTGQSSDLKLSLPDRNHSNRWVVLIHWDLSYLSSAPQAAEEWLVPRAPRGPRPPPRPGESVYSDSSGPVGSCSASHRLTHTVTQDLYSNDQQFTKYYLFLSHIYKNKCK